MITKGLQHLAKSKVFPGNREVSANGSKSGNAKSRFAFETDLCQARLRKATGGQN